MPSSPPPDLRPLLVERTIRWLPVEDGINTLAVAPGTIASVEPLVVQREVLLAVESHLRAERGRALGILRGAIYRCPRMRLDYLLVDGVVRADALADTTDEDAARRSALATLIAGVEREGGCAVGWYRGNTAVRPRITAGDVAIHAACFAQQWPVALLKEGAGARAAAFVRLSPAPQRPYMVPFHELVSAEPRQEGEPLRTAITWPNYRTESVVVPLPELRRESEATVPFSGPAASTPLRSASELDANRPRRISGRVAPFVPPSATPTSSRAVEGTPSPAVLADVPNATPPAHLEVSSGAASALPVMSPTPTPTPPRPPSDSAVDRLFDDPPPRDLADEAGGRGPGGRGRRTRVSRRPLPNRSAEGTPLFSSRAARAAMVAALVAVAVGGTWFATHMMDGTGGIAGGDGTSSATSDTVVQNDAATAEHSGVGGGTGSSDSAAAMARFAAARLDESLAHLNQDLRLIAAALDTSATGTLAPGACALADSAHTRSLLDLDAINLAQRYLKRPLDPAHRQRVISLSRRTDAAGTALRRLCPASQQ